MIDDSGIVLTTDIGRHSRLSLRQYYPTIGLEQLKETIKFFCHKFVSRAILGRLSPGEN